jgi:hypothetical protein
MKMSDRRADLQPVEDEVINALGGKLTILACCFFVVSVFLAIISLRCLYGDGSFQLTEVLKAGHFAAVAKNRYCASLIFQLPLLAALKLGCTNLYLLQLAFGAGCFLPWVVSMALCYWMAPRHFWLVMLGCAFGHLNAAFFPVGEYIIAHAFFWPVLFAVLFVRPLTLSAAIIMVVSSLVLLFSYESLLFLGPLLGVLALAGVFRDGERIWSRVAFGLSYVLLISAALIALDGVLYTQFPENFARFKQGTLTMLLYPPWTMGWSFIWLFLMGVVCVGGWRFTKRQFKLGLTMMAAAIIIWGIWPLLDPGSLSVWRQFQCRPMQLMVPLVLLAVAWAMTRRPGWFESRRPYLVAFSASWLLAQSLWQISATWQWNGFVGICRGVLATQQGPIQLLHRTELEKIALQRRSLQGQALWFFGGWENPYLSIMLAPSGQVSSIILSPFKPPWEPFDPLDLSSLPQLEKYGVDYSNYTKAVLKLKEALSNSGRSVSPEEMGAVLYPSLTLEQKAIFGRPVSPKEANAVLSPLTPEQKAAQVKAGQARRVALQQSMIKFYQHKAEAGEGFAQMRLGEIYLRGEGVKTNTNLARKWLSAAMTNGCPQATNLLSEIERGSARSK